MNPTLTLQAYVDGELASTTVAPETAIASSVFGLYVGVWAIDFGYEYKGRLDDLRIYDGVLSDVEIRELAGVSVPSLRTVPLIGLILLLGTASAIAVGRMQRRSA